MAKPIVYVSQSELRRVYADGDYDGRLHRGELLSRVIDDNHPSRPKAREPFCTRSQMIQLVRVRDHAVLVLAHQYRRRDGTLGASGKPDPKRIYLADRILSLEQPAQP